MHTYDWSVIMQIFMTIVTVRPPDSLIGLAFIVISVPWAITFSVTCLKEEAGRRATRPRALSLSYNDNNSHLLLGGRLF